MIDAIISGSFKPAPFIHPFEEFYTTSGYQDQGVLPEFFTTTDELAQGRMENPDTPQKEDFLSFVYMFFLMIHPFIDGNGRVARNLLDYYNEALPGRIKPVWNSKDPKFSGFPFHKEAFNSFFHKEAKLTRRAPINESSHEQVASLLTLHKTDLATLTIKLIESCRLIRTTADFDSSIGIKTMAEGIRSLQ